MAGSFCDYLENGILNLYFGATAFAAAGTHYIGICTGVTDAGVITGEPTSGGSYARVTKTNNKTTWSTATTGSLSNAVAITFATCTTPDWGSGLDTFFISDSLAGATNTLVWGDLDTSKTINIGYTAEFAIGALTISLD